MESGCGCRDAGQGESAFTEADRKIGERGFVVKIRRVRTNNHKKCFEVSTSSRVMDFPYAQLDIRPTFRNHVSTVYVDEELGREGFTYELADGRTDSVHIDHVLFYHRDPAYMREALLHELTVEAIKKVRASRLSKRELIRRLGTSASQFYRLLDPTNYRKSIDQMVTLLSVLGCEIELKFKSATFLA